MLKIADYFLDEKIKKYYYVKLHNKNKKPITFSWIVYDFNFDYFKGDFSNELLKMEIVCSNPLKVFKKFMKSNTSNSVHNFWCLKKGTTQYLGISFEKFLNIIKGKKGLIFNYPIIHQNYYLIFNGISHKSNSYRLFIYFDNHYYSYIDLIKFFQKEMRNINADFNLIKIKKIKVPKRRQFFNIKTEVPKLLCTLGYKSKTDYVEFYYFIKNFRNKTKTFIDNLSHLLVWSNEEPIKYNEVDKFSFYQEELLCLDEISILALRTSKFKNNKFGFL